MIRVYIAVAVLAIRCRRAERTRRMNYVGHHGAAA